MFIRWDDSWRIGNSVIDYDHQMLVNITNQLWDAKELSHGADDADMVARVLAQLVSYVKRHFAREEKIFMASEYPLKDQHRAMHRELVKVVADIATLYQREPDLLDLDEIVDFMQSWLEDHIVKHDRGYRDYISLDALERSEVA